MKSKDERPIVWLGGTGLPRGATGRELSNLGHPLLWEPITQETITKLVKMEPVLVVVDADRMTTTLRKILQSLDERRQFTNFVVFLLGAKPRVRLGHQVDGRLTKGRGLVSQISAALATLEAAAKFKAEDRKTQRQLKRARSELGRLRNLVVRDDLTCLYNLRFFNRSLETEHSRAMRFGRHYSLIFMDLDGLRDVNSRYGHLAGGQVLQQLGEFLNTSLRRIDIPSRVGGDEFVIICPETAKLSARVLAERLRCGIEALKLHGDKDYPGITASIGVASFPEDGEAPEKVLEHADRALYEAKARGKNTVCCWGDFPAKLSSDNQFGGVHHMQPSDEPDEEDAGSSELESLTPG
jgi:diguanylate cyclase (GGDEF)-like protein